MECKIGGEMSTGRVLGPRNVMSNGCVVRTRTASGISMMVVITIFRFGMEGSKRLSLISCGELWFLVRVSCARYRYRMTGSWAVMFLNRRQVLL